jgi:hypothetical protein
MRSKWTTAYLAAMHKKPEPAGDGADPSAYYCVKHRAAFLAALRAAKEDGSIENWAMSQLLGIAPPPSR